MLFLHHRFLRKKSYVYESALLFRSTQFQFISAKFI